MQHGAAPPGCPALPKRRPELVHGVLAARRCFRPPARLDSTAAAGGRIGAWGPGWRAGAGVRSQQGAARGEASKLQRSAAVGRNQTLASPSPEDAAKSGCREMVCRCHDADVHGGCGKAIKRTRSSAECARSFAEKRHHAGSSCEASGQYVEGGQLCLPCNSLRTS